MIDMQESAAMAEGRIWKVGEIVGTVDREAPKAEPGRFGWYIVYTGGASEARCQLQLERRGWSVYVPMIETWRPKFRPRVPRGRLRAERRKRITMPEMEKVETPRYPGYLFVEARSPGHEYWDLLRIPNIADVIRRLDGVSIRLAQPVIEAIKAKGTKAPDKPPKPLLPKVGSRVRIVNGPFLGFYGEIEEAVGIHAIKVGVAIFARTTPVVLALDEIEILQ